MRQAAGWTATSAAALLVLTGCGEPQITTYRVAKDRPSVKADPHADPHAGHAHGDQPAARPRLTWTLPAGWQETEPGRVNLAAFNIAGPGDTNAQVTVASLPLLAGRETDVVNLWRGQLGLSQLEPDQAREQLKELSINDEKAKIFELTSGNAEKPEKIVTVMIHRANASWFYKLSGHAVAVEAQRATFVDFIKTIRESSAPEPGAIAAAPPAPATPASFAKSAPAGWKSLPPGSMQAARFAVPEVNGATGLVSVSVFDSDTGGTPANVNRWRRQIGLDALSPELVAAAVTPLDPRLPKAVLVDMTNQTQQLIGAIVPHGAQWYFYKLTGNPAAVAAQKEAFVRFAASEPTP